MTLRRVRLLTRAPLSRNARYRRTAKGHAMVQAANARARAKRAPEQRAVEDARRLAWERAHALQRRVYKRVWARAKYWRLKRKGTTT